MWLAGAAHWSGQTQPHVTNQAATPFMLHHPYRTGKTSLKRALRLPTCRFCWIGAPQLSGVACTVWMALFCMS